MILIFLKLMQYDAGNVKLHQATEEITLTMANGLNQLISRILHWTLHTVTYILHTQHFISTVNFQNVV